MGSIVRLVILALATGAFAFGQDGDLIYAAQQDDLATVSALLKSGVDANTHRSPHVAYGTSALIEASANGHLDVVKALLAANADVEVKRVGGNYRQGGTALMVASSEGRLEVVQALLAAKADTSANDGDKTALTLASVGGHLDVVKVLLAAGADPNPKRAEGPLSAMSLDRVKANVEIVKALLAAKADPNIKLQSGEAPLMMYLGKRDLEIARALVEAGAKVTTTGFTPLMGAAAQNGPGSLELVRAILNAHADVNTGFYAQPAGYQVGSAVGLHSIGTTALGIAASSGSLDIVQALLASGLHADVNARQHAGDTPLTIASANGRADVVRLLLAAKADVNVKNDSGATALALALRNNYPNVVAILKSAGAVE